MLVEDFKNCVSERMVVYLNEQKVTTLQQAAVLADEYALTHKPTFTKRESCEPPPRSSDVQVVRSDSVKMDKQGFFCRRSDHLIADCPLWKRKQQGVGAGAAPRQPKGVGLIKTLSLGGSGPTVQTPDECFKPFTFEALVSLTGKAEDQRPVKVLRDTGGSQSLILSSA